MSEMQVEISHMLKDLDKYKKSYEGMSRERTCSGAHCCLQESDGSLRACSIEHT
jgi:hypothetical protein